MQSFLTQVNFHPTQFFHGDVEGTRLTGENRLTLPVIIETATHRYRFA